jgi:hypothetical protein
MKKITYPGNPYALLIDNVVTEVVYMQNYTEEEIADTLSKHDYEEVVSCSEYGKEILVGWIKLEDEVVEPAPHPLWTFNHTISRWVPPAKWDETVEGYFRTFMNCCESNKNTNSLEESIYAN